MKEYFIIRYHNPNGENRYFTDPTRYPTEADARAHIKKDVYAMIERQFEEARYEDEDE